jgi:type II secretory pathway component PulK
MKTGSWTNNRGIALLIVLLVTALLIALIFEFAYATRISLNSAVNFRDSQRAYFLARAGVYAFIKYTDMLTGNIPQNEWGVVPIISEGDTQVRIKWEDEQGKISIPVVVQGNDAYKRIQQLFDIKSVSQDVLDNGIVEKKSFYLLSELHQVMSDEDYNKVKDFLTVAPVMKININTASREVLQSLCKSLGKDDSVVGLIINRRNDQLFTSTSEITNMPGMESLALVASYLDVTSNTYKVNSYATVGGYTRQVEAFIQRGSTIPLYWRAL